MDRLAHQDESAEEGFTIEQALRAYETYREWNPFLHSCSYKIAEEMERKRIGVLADNPNSFFGRDLFLELRRRFD